MTLKSDEKLQKSVSNILTALNIASEKGVFKTIQESAQIFNDLNYIIKALDEVEKKDV